MKKWLARIYVRYVLSTDPDSEKGAGMLANVMELSVAIILAGVGAYFVPVLMSGFGTAYASTNSTFPLAQTATTLGPGIIIIGWVISVGVFGFLGIKGIVSHSKGG